MENYVVGIGEVLFDVFPDERKLGGAPANFAYHVAQLGLRGCVISAIGDDALGDEVVNVLSQTGMQTYLERTSQETGQVLVTVDEKGIPSYQIKEGVAYDFISWSPKMEEIVRHTCAVCFGTLAQRSPRSRETIRRFLQEMPCRDSVLKIYDINLRQHFYSKELVEESLTMCNVLKINDEEMAIVKDMLALPGNDLTTWSKTLQEQYGLKMLILTCGTEGSQVFYVGGMSQLPTPHVKVADTVGAGDSFTAAFCCGILSGRTIADAHRLAVDVSAYICTQSGAMVKLPENFKKI